MKKNISKAVSVVLSLVFVVIAVPLSFLIVEGMLRLKNTNQKNYEIEMWRYANELKTISEDPALGHVHRPSSSAILQSVEIRTNKFGLRGPDININKNIPRVLFLGSSITLGWGVPEDKTIAAQTARLLREDGFDVQVFNAGIGNYNSSRYVNLFLTKLKQIEPSDIVVHFFLRDAEILESKSGHWLLRKSQLAVTLWNIYQQIKMRKGNVTIATKYKELYDPSHPGYQQMVKALERLRDYANANHIRLYLAMTPDVHNLTDYSFSSIHDQMAELSKTLGYHYVDLYPSLKGLKPEEIWSLPGDPHPNSLGHLKMAEMIVPALEKEIFHKKTKQSTIVN